MNNKLRPAIIGGVVMGLLSGLPYVNLGNVACCLWVVLGGALATYLYIRQSSTPVELGEGAVLGMLAGIIGTIVQLLVGVPVAIMTDYPVQRMAINLMERVNPEQAETYRQRLEEMMTRPFFEQFFASTFSLGTLLVFIITVVIALVGGLVAVPLFEKRKADTGGPPPPPPPPPYYGGTPGDAYAPPPPPPPGGYGPGA